MKFNPHPEISEVYQMGKKTYFPISWLHRQEYCEYQIFLENVKGIHIEPTKEMIKGTNIHDQLEKEFLEKAKPATFEEMLDRSREITVISRELRVVSHEFGLIGLIDEIHMNPNNFIIIDDKPGTKPYLSNIHQVYGYCLAFKEMVGDKNNRTLKTALRERGTDNIFWIKEFDEDAENEIISVINHVQELLSGDILYKSNKNPNKCRSCRLKNACDRAINP